MRTHYLTQEPRFSGKLSGFFGKTFFYLFLGLESGQGDWNQGKGTGIRARGLESGQGDWNQGKGTGIRARGLESGQAAACKKSKKKG